MKIALFIEGGVDRSGERDVIHARMWLIERLARAHEVHVYTLMQEPVPAEWTLRGAAVHNIARTPGWRRRLSRTFAAEHRVAPFDVLHAHFGWGGSYAALLGWRHWLPVAFHAGGAELARLEDIGYGMGRSVAGRLRRWIILRGASRVTVASASMQRLAAALGIEARLVMQGVALDRWPVAAPRRRVSGTAARLLHVGDIRPVKDQHTLLAAAVILMTRGVPFTLDMVGHDTMDGALQHSVNAMALGDRIRWHGVLDRTALRALMDASDLLVVSSLHEGGPLVVLEAAVAGVPTVGSAVGHVADFAPTAAYAVPVGDAAQLAAAIGELVANEELRLRIAVAAQALAVEYDADHTARITEEVFREITA